jgi:hypothetical protein
MGTHAGVTHEVLPPGAQALGVAGRVARGGTPGEVPGADALIFREAFRTEAAGEIVPAGKDPGEVLGGTCVGVGSGASMVR